MMKVSVIFSAFITLSLLILPATLGQGINLSPELYEHRMMADGRRYLSIQVRTTDLFGNSTELMYYYATLYVGDFDNLSEQALIIDTGSGIMSFPCEGYCKHCGKHINNYYPLDSKSLTLQRAQLHEYLIVKWMKGVPAATARFASSVKHMGRDQATMVSGSKTHSISEILLRKIHHSGMSLAV